MRTVSYGMVFHRVSGAQVTRIVEGFAKGLSITAVAKLASVDPRTAAAWHERAKHGIWQGQYSRCGRKRAMDAKTAAMALDMLKSGQYPGATEVAHELHAQGLTSGSMPLCRTTINRYARQASKAGGSRLRTNRRPPRKRLSVLSRTKRCAAARRWARWTTAAWRKVAFTDRVRVIYSQRGGCSIQRVAYLETGEQRESPQVNHGQALNMYCMLTPAGMTYVHVVTGTHGFKSSYHNKKGKASKSITSEEYRDVLKHTLLPQGSAKFKSLGVTKWYMQQDNDPSHNVVQEELQAWNASHQGQHVALLREWPPNSPDLSPIENVWSIVKYEVLQKAPSGWAAFKKAVLDAVKGLKQQTIDHLYGSMPKRVKLVLDRGGDKTGY